MSLLGKGIRKLSELEIDADKDWQAKGITNLRELAPGMARGDLIIRGHSVLTRLPAGPVDYILASTGPGDIPQWIPVPGPLEIFLPKMMLAGMALLVIPIDKVISETSLAVDTVIETTDVPTQAISMEIAENLSVITIDKTIFEESETGTSLQYQLWQDVDGAVAEDNGVRTDETAEATDDTLNNMNLLPDPVKVDGAYYFGFDDEFDLIRLRQDTPGEGVWSTIWEYWDGSGWTGLANVDDPTDGFRPASAGLFDITWDTPGDWAKKDLEGMELYWVRARVDAFTSHTTQPKGTRARVLVAEGSV